MYCFKCTLICIDLLQIVSAVHFKRSLGNMHRIQVPLLHSSVNGPLEFMFMFLGYIEFLLLGPFLFLFFYLMLTQWEA